MHIAELFSGAPSMLWYSGASMLQSEENMHLTTEMLSYVFLFVRAQVSCLTWDYEATKPGAFQLISFCLKE